MLSVARPHEKLLIGRDAHESVVSGLILAGIQPAWADLRWDADRHLADPPSADDFEADDFEADDFERAADRNRVPSSLYRVT